MSKIIYTCPNCGKCFEDYLSNRKKSKSGLHFCSQKCKGAYQTAEAIKHAPVKLFSVCISCLEEKPASEFYRDKKSRANGGIQYKCKECIKIERSAYYDKNVAAVNARVHKYQELNPGSHGKGQEDKSRGKAQRALNYAVESGRIQKPDTCQLCHNPARLHAHHWHGYDNPLDVVWLCPSCHHFAHGRGPKARLAERKGSPAIDWESVIYTRKVS